VSRHPAPPVVARLRPYPGQGSMWFFVIGDLCIFACYFAGYVHDRAHDVQGFLDGQRLLSPGMGVLDTVVLLTSSFFVALCAQATRAGDARVGSRFLALGAACGAAFMAIKACEWHGAIAGGLPAATYSFFTYYFMLTGLHVLHVALGLVILGLGWRELRGARKPRVDFVEATATYWHMVDALWVTIFAGLYLLR
jgi:nitric oxide reductase NorE protein